MQQNISAGIDTRDLLKFAGFVRQIGSTLGLDTDKQTELEAQAMELHRVASSPAPEAGRLRRLANAILHILGAAASTVASQTAPELALQGATRTGRLSYFALNNPGGGWVTGV